MGSNLICCQCMSWKSKNHRTKLFFGRKLPKCKLAHLKELGVLNRMIPKIVLVLNSESSMIFLQVMIFFNELVRMSYIIPIWWHFYKVQLFCNFPSEITKKSHSILSSNSWCYTTIDWGCKIIGHEGKRLLK